MVASAASDPAKFCVVDNAPSTLTLIKAEAIELVPLFLNVTLKGILVHAMDEPFVGFRIADICASSFITKGWHPFDVVNPTRSNDVRDAFNLVHWLAVKSNIHASSA